LVPDDRQWHCRNHPVVGSPEQVRCLLYQNPSDPSPVPPSRDELWGPDRFH
jgi:hypothetical protein